MLNGRTAQNDKLCQNGKSGQKTKIAKEIRNMRVPKMIILAKADKKAKKLDKMAIMAHRPEGQKRVRTAELTKNAEIVRMAKMAEVPKRRIKPDWSK